MSIYQWFSLCGYGIGHTVSVISAMPTVKVEISIVIANICVGIVIAKGH